MARRQPARRSRRPHGRDHRARRDRRGQDAAAKRPRAEGEPLPRSHERPCVHLGRPPAAAHSRRDVSRAGPRPTSAGHPAGGRARPAPHRAQEPSVVLRARRDRRDSVRARRDPRSDLDAAAPRRAERMGRAARIDPHLHPELRERPRRSRSVARASAGAGFDLDQAGAQGCARAEESPRVRRRQPRGLSSHGRRTRSRLADNVVRIGPILPQAPSRSCRLSRCRRR